MRPLQRKLYLLEMTNFRKKIFIKVHEMNAFRQKQIKIYARVPKSKKIYPRHWIIDVDEGVG